VGHARICWGWVEQGLVGITRVHGPLHAVEDLEDLEPCSEVAEELLFPVTKHTKCPED